MKRQGGDFIIHCLFVDDMMHVPTCDAFKQEFMAKYTKDFQITGGCPMDLNGDIFGLRLQPRLRVLPRGLLTQRQAGISLQNDVVGRWISAYATKRDNTR